MSGPMNWILGVMSSIVDLIACNIIGNMLKVTYIHIKLIYIARYRKSIRITEYNVTKVILLGTIYNFAYC
jgi:hypothetical protein